jgi:hypothetical protein
MKLAKFAVIGTAIVLLVLGALYIGDAQAQNMQFGGRQSVAFAQDLWDAMQGYENWPMKSDFYEGQEPHGAILRMYYNMVSVEGIPYHVIIKDNYGGENATISRVRNNPGNYLGSVTVMVQREEGYDPEHNNWFWAKYLPDGTMDKNPKGIPLAGKVAKMGGGEVAGCIGCHQNAAGEDYLFTND